MPAPPAPCPALLLPDYDMDTVRGHLYTSTDNGATWERRRGGGCYALLMSADGSRLTVLSMGDSYMPDYGWWTSTDGGATFTRHAPIVGFQEGKLMAGSADGLTLLSARPGACYDIPGGGACPGEDDAHLFTSADGGTSWTEANAQVGFFTALAVSGNGQRMLAGVRALVANGDLTLWSSGDGGATWTQRAFPTPLKTNGMYAWTGLASSHDGMRLLAVMGAGFPWCGGCWSMVQGGCCWDCVPALRHLLHCPLYQLHHPLSHEPLPLPCISAGHLQMGGRRGQSGPPMCSKTPTLPASMAAPPLPMAWSWW